MNLQKVKTLLIPEGSVGRIKILKNLVGSSIDTDRSIYNGCGYLDGYRLSSSGAIKEYSNDYYESTVTGFIPVANKDIVYIDGCYWYNASSALNYICGYDSSFNFIGAEYSSQIVDNGIYYYGTKFIEKATGNKHHARVVLMDIPNLAYIRVSCTTGYLGETISGSHIKVSTRSSTITMWENYKYKYKNWVRYSTEADGETIYNGGLGYKDGYRIRSGGAEAEVSYITITGYIPLKKGDTLRIYPAFTGQNTSNTINFYDGGFNNLGQVTDSGNYYGICVNGKSIYKSQVINGVSTLTLTDSHDSNIAYVRIGNAIYEIISGAEMIVTVNEEFT